jgi:adenosylmethionine-8-amino-7-oxononanoate aminotransferase
MFDEVMTGMGRTGKMFGPPFIITEAQIDEAVEILKQALNKDLLSGNSPFLTF